MNKSIIKKISTIFLVLVMLFTITGVKETEAASNPNTLMLGVFFNSYEDQTSPIYVSFDGKNFKKISNVIVDADGAGPGAVSTYKEELGLNYDVYCLVDPSLQYHDGIFWSMAGDTPFDATTGQDKLQTMLSYSPDLINWSIPNSGCDQSGTEDSKWLNATINVPDKPYDRDGNLGAKEFDCAAPDLFIDDDGTGWVVACLGYYGGFHGEPGHDYVRPYIVKIENLKPGTTEAPTTEGLKALTPRGKYSDAVPMNLKGATSKDYIDSSIYKENGKYYLSIKRDGVYNEIWTTNKISLNATWTKVVDSAVTGYEGPALTKFMSHYYMYVDKLADYPAENPDWTTGTFVTYSSSINGEWDKPVRITTKDINGKDIPNRHGYVITLTDKKAIDIVMKAYRAAGYNDTPVVQEFVSGTPDKIPGYNLRWSHSGDTEKDYWYENGVKQGVKGSKGNVWYDNTERGREICDPATNGWYWLDVKFEGAKAINKEVFMPYIYSNEKEFTQEQKDGVINASNTYTEDPNGITANMGEQVKKAMEEGTGKWVRYDAEGKMIKGWYTVQGKDVALYPNQAGNTYYYDYMTGLMAKGWTNIGGTDYYFDPIFGTLQQ